VPKQMTSWTKPEFDARRSEVEKALHERFEGVKPIGAPPTETDVFDGVVAIDSKLVATEARPVIEKVMGAPFPLKLIRKGGYGSKEDAVNHLVAGLREWCRDESTATAGATPE